MSHKNKKARQFLNDAYATHDETSQLSFYQKWAADYDEQMEQGLGYLSPDKIAAALSRYIGNKQAAVLDIGCGTGLTAKALADLGFTTIDGLDYSAQMIKVAQDKGIYRRLIQADLNQPLAIDSADYHALISSGTFTHGHVGPEPFDELLRVLKPKGYLACTVHRDLWQSRGFETKFESLQASASLCQLEIIKDAFFEGGELEGLFCVYQKL